MATEREKSTGRMAADCGFEEGGCDSRDEAQAGMWLRIAVAAVFAGQGMVFSLAVNLTPPDFGSAAYWILHGGLIFSTVLVLVFLGGPLFRATFDMVWARRLSIEGLFTLSLAGAFAGSLVSTFTGQGSVYYEVVSVVLAIYMVGRLVGERSRAKLATESERVRERFDRAVVLEEDGSGVAMPLAEVTAGSRVLVGAGEPFTVDGVVVEGVGYVRETALTGEPLPVVRRRGDWVRAGTWSEDGVFQVEAQAVEGERELDGILRTVEDASGRPSELQTQANELIQGFLPLVAGLSAATAIFWGFTGTWVDAVLNSMAVLLVACPCALGLATPVAIWQGLFQLAKSGLVSRDGALIDVLGRTRRMFFDKTGTLSESSMRVTEVLAAEAWARRRGDLWDAVGMVEAEFRHPVARALAEELATGNRPESRVESRGVIAGKGVEGEVLVGGERWRLRIGEPDLAEDAGAEVEALCGRLRERGGKRIFVFVNGRPAAVLVLRERYREGVATVWEALARLGVKACVLTGDPDPELELPREVKVRSGLSAREKEEIVAASRAAGEEPVFVGDGINDASAMARASASIAMGSGTGLTRSAASGQLTGDRIDVLPDAVVLARRLRGRLRGNLYYAAAYNVVGMGLAAAGMLHPVAAAAIMLVSSFWVTGRALKETPISDRGEGSREEAGATAGAR